MADLSTDETQEVIIRDGTTSNNELKVNSDGSINVVSSAIGPNARTLLNLQFDQFYSNPKATTWQQLFEYSVPMGYAVSLTSVLAVNNSTACQNRLVAEKNLATYNAGTDTFVGVFAATAPKFYSRLECDVVTDSTGGAWTMTVTYTNQDGTTNRTATLAVTNTFDSNQHYLLTLQAGDYGVRAVTNVTRSIAGLGGTFELVGVDEISYYDTEAAWKVNEKVYGKDALVFEPGQYDHLSLQRYADSTSSFYTRHIASFSVYQP